MKRFALCFALLSSMIVPAYSADKVPFSWTGLYVGADVGYAWGGVDVFQTNGGMPLGPFDYDTKGFSGGLSIGYNQQFGMAVIGVEAEGGHMDLGGNGKIPSSTPGHYQAIDLEGGLYGILAARAGLTIDRTLVYGKVGWAYWDASAGQKTTKAGFVTHRTGAFDGLVYGAGIEHALNGGWSVKLEWLRFDFGDQSGDQTSITDPPIGFVYENKHSLTADTVKLGVRYKF